MKLKRFLRDFAVLAGFCGAFYLLTTVMSGLDEEQVDDSDFSVIRKRADVSLKNRDWETASTNYLSLAQKDPYNGHAWYRCARSFKNQRDQIFLKLLAVKADAEEAGTQSDEAQAETERLVESLRDELDGLGGRAKDAFRKAKEFARYRADSLLHLAALESYDGNNSLSLEYLDEFVDNGSYTQQGLAAYRAFGTGGPSYTSPIVGSDAVGVRLHAEPKFWEIVRKEGFNQSR